VSLWKSLVDRMKDKKDELQRKAVKKAAQGALDSAGRAIEKAIFGDSKADAAEAEKVEAVDPFAKLKAAEAQTRDRERQDKAKAKERAAAKAKVDEEVDAELAAMKKKLRK
jgi:hypothetical protein